MAEPGRALVAEAGVIAAEALLVARKSPDDLHRWVYLDIGRFSGLAETEGEAIRYQIVAEREGPSGPCVIAGPSCDSAGQSSGMSNRMPLSCLGTRLSAALARGR